MGKKILYIESGTNICSIAIAEGKSLLGIKENDISNAHASQLTVFINEVLAATKLSAKQLDAVAISKGPGSYTGLRIGVSAAKGICYAADIPLIAIDSLDSFACGVVSEKHKFIQSNKIDLVCPMIDARRMEVYSALYDLSLNKIDQTKALIIDDYSFQEQLANHRILFFGNGSGKSTLHIKHDHAFFYEDFFPSAQFMIPLALKAFDENRFEDVAYFEPYYLKDFVATQSKNKVAPQ